MKHALTIAGSDCSGGAGIQADLKTFAAHGIYGMSAIVSVVAENTCRVLDIQDITPDMIEKQIIAVFEDIEVHAVKVGMLSTRAGMLAVSKMLKQYRPKHVVIDPVMVAKGGCALMQEEALSTLIEEMIPLADVLTPNIPEAEAITGMKIQSEEERKRAAVSIYQMGAKHVLIKGGHLSQEEECHRFAVRRQFFSDICYQTDSYQEYAWYGLHIFLCHCFKSRIGLCNAASSRQCERLCHYGNYPCIGNRQRSWPYTPLI